MKLLIGYAAVIRVVLVLIGEVLKYCMVLVLVLALTVEVVSTVQVPWRASFQRHWNATKNRKPAWDVQATCTTGFVSIKCTLLWRHWLNKFTCRLCVPCTLSSSVSIKKIVKLSVAYPWCLACLSLDPTVYPFFDKISLEFFVYPQSDMDQTD